jgi:hypothetical protein
MMKWTSGRQLRPSRQAGSSAQLHGARGGLGFLVWPLGIAATGFLFAATITVFVVWLPVILFFALIGNQDQSRLARAALAGPPV